MDRLLEETTERLFTDHVGKATLDAAENGEFPSELWSRFHAAGLHLAGSPGSDTSWPDLFGVLKVAGRHAAPLPLAEILVAEAILGANDEPDHASDADAAIQPGFTTIATGGVAPWGRAANRVFTVDGEVATDFAFHPNTNVAGEPRDEVTLRAAASVPVPEHLDELLALSRVALMAGALERILEISVEYALLRTQFGRPIAKFQAVQHNLAILAGEVAAATCAGDAAIAACGTERFPDEVAAAKARVGEAAGIGAEIAHQVHGAIGFTHEHSLHHFTRRLWAWRDEHGREAAWQARLGKRIAAGTADRVWEFLVDG